MTSDPGTLPEPTDGSRGLIAETLSLVGSLSRHLQALLALAGSESREAAALYIRLLIMLIASLIFAALGYIFVVLAAAVAIAMLFKIAWVWIAFGLAIFHVLAALLCARHIKSRCRTPVFSSTAAEVRKDIASLCRKEP